MKKVWTIARNTLRETVRDKLFYALIAFALLSIGASVLAGTVSLGQDARVITDFSLTAILVFLLVITLLIGTQLVYREIDRKTIYVSITKPITRDQFYLGKFIGLCLTTGLSALVMGAIFLAVLATKTHHLSVPALWAIGAIILEIWLLTALSLLFSVLTSPLAGAIYTFCLVLIGQSSSSILFIAQKSSAFLKGALEFVYYAFPNLEKFNLRNQVVYNFHPSAASVLMIVLYFVGYTGALLLLGMAIFRSHEF